MAESRWHGLSIAARSALAAGLVSAILLVVTGLWFRHAVFTGAMDSALDRAREQRSAIVALMDAGRLESERPLAFGDTSYEIVRSDGHRLLSSDDLWPYERDRPVITLPPDDLIGRDGAEYLTATFGPEPADPAGDGLGERSRRWADRTVAVVSGHRLVYDVDPLQVTPVPVHKPDAARVDQDQEPIDLGPTVGVYVFVSPFDAEQARADVDRVLWPAMPVGVLLVMLVAYLATRVGLRPVESIRAQTAGITSRDLHRRVPVPPTRDAVAQLATTLNETLDRLQRSSDQQRRFVADVTHELRSPVASLRAVLEVAATHADRADWPEVAGDAIEDLDRIQALIDDLLTLARFDAGDLTATEPLDLDVLVPQHLAGRSSYDGIVVKAVTLEEALVDGNARELDRLVRNLVDNAERHARSAVEISVRSDDGRVVLTVADDGPGIPPDDRSRVFERFVRLDDARSRGEGGAGLGLAIAHDIVVRHRGRISARGRPGGGALLHVVLPLRGED